MVDFHIYDPLQKKGKKRLERRHREIGCVLNNFAVLHARIPDERVHDVSRLQIRHTVTDHYTVDPSV